MFQIFCSHLGQLIRWLYSVSEKIDLMAPPTVDIDSVKSSLAEYQVRAEPRHPVILQNRGDSEHACGSVYATLAVSMIAPVGLLSHSLISHLFILMFIIITVIPYTIMY